MESSLCMVLKTVDYRDNDKIITLFSRELGKITVMASGVKNLKNELSYAAQPLCCGIFSYTEKNGKLFLKQCELKKNYVGLAGNYEAFLAACSLTDYADRLLSVSDETEELFVLLVNCIDALSRDVSPREVLCFFMVRVLDMLGLGPLLDECSVCGNPVPLPHSFSSEYGGVVCDDCSRHEKTTEIPEKTGDMVPEMLEIRPVEFTGNNKANQKITEFFAEYLRIMTDIPIKLPQTL